MRSIVCWPRSTVAQADSTCSVSPSHGRSAWLLASMMTPRSGTPDSSTSTLSCYARWARMGSCEGYPCSLRWSMSAKPALPRSTGMPPFPQHALGCSTKADVPPRRSSCCMVTCAAPSHQRRRAIIGTSYFSLTTIRITCGLPCCRPRMLPRWRSRASRLPPSTRAGRS